MKRIGVFNAKYSPNLGDGLLAECMEKTLIELGFDENSIIAIDTAARTEYRFGKVSRSYLLKVLHSLPNFLRRWLLFFPLTYIKHKKWLPCYREKLQHSEALIIGGGNLFTDMDLNFPTKISAILNEANKLKLPVYVYGVGVGKDWSKKGRKMISNSLKSSDIKYFSVRDNESKLNLQSLFGQDLKIEPTVVRDPGLLASRHLLEIEKVETAQENVVGICVTCSSAVNYHSELVLTEDFLLGWYVKAYQELISHNLTPKIFTNGSPEDVRFASMVIDQVGKNLDDNLHPIQPKNPFEIVNTISTMRAVIAFRMHALIAAHSNNVEIFALKWDPKLDSFMNSINQGHRLYSVVSNSPEFVVNEINAALKTENDQSKTLDVVNEAYQDMKLLVRTIQNS